MSDLRDLLERIVPALNQAGVPFMIAGSFASTAHGLPRATQDLDIVIDPSGKALAALLGLLPQEHPLLGVEVSMASAEDTIIAKLEWSKASGGSERQRRDGAGMLATVGDDLDYAYLERWLNELDLSDEWELAKRTQLA